MKFHSVFLEIIMFSELWKKKFDFFFSLARVQFVFVDYMKNWLRRSDVTPLLGILTQERILGENFDIKKGRIWWRICKQSSNRQKTLLFKHFYAFYNMFFCCRGSKRGVCLWFNFTFSPQFRIACKKKKIKSKHCSKINIFEKMCLIFFFRKKMLNRFSLMIAVNNESFLTDVLVFLTRSVQFYFLKKGNIENGVWFESLRK